MMLGIFDRADGLYYRGNEWNGDAGRYRAVFGELDSGVRQYPTVKKAEAALRWIVSAAGFDFPDMLEIVKLPPGTPEAVPPKKAERNTAKTERDDVSAGFESGNAVNVPGERAARADEMRDCLKCPYFLDKPADKIPQSPEKQELPPLFPVSENDLNGWETVDGVGEKNLPPLMMRKRFRDTSCYAIKMPDGGFFYLPGEETLAWNRYYEECKLFVIKRVKARRIKMGLDPDGMDEWR